MSERKKHSAEFRANAVAEAARLGVAEAAKALGVDPSLIYKWRIREQGGNGETAAVLSTIPTTRLNVRQKPKALVPETFRCPHCGGQVYVAPGGSNGP